MLLELAVVPLQGSNFWILFSKLFEFLFFELKKFHSNILSTKKNWQKLFQFHYLSSLKLCIQTKNIYSHTKKKMFMIITHNIPIHKVNFTTFRMDIKMFYNTSDDAKRNSKLIIIDSSTKDESIMCMFLFVYLHT